MGSTLFKNSSPNGWIVQKFGGTSVGKFPDKIAEDIVRYVSDSHLALGSVGGSAAAVRRRAETEGGTKQGRDEDADLFFFPSRAGHMFRTTGWWWYAQPAAPARR